MIFGYEWESNWEKKVYDKYPCLELLYEEDLEDSDKHNETAAKIFNYLGLDFVQVNTEFVRKSSKKFEDDIENHEDFFNYFRNTNYEHYLDY